MTFFFLNFILKNNTSTRNPSVSKIHFNLAEICFHNICYNINLSSSSSSPSSSSSSSSSSLGSSPSPPANTTVQSCSCELFYIKAQDNSRHRWGWGVFDGIPLKDGINREASGCRWRMWDEGGMCSNEEKEVEPMLLLIT